MCPAEHAYAIDRAVFPGLQGGPHDHTTAAIAVALHEAAQPGFAAYARADRGQRHRAGRGADRARLRARLRRHRQPPAARRPDGQGHRRSPRRRRRSSRAGIVCNYNAVPFDPRPPLDPSGIRLGTPAITTRGLRAEHMEEVARWIDEAVEAARRADAAALDRVRGEVLELARTYPPPA